MPKGAGSDSSSFWPWSFSERHWSCSLHDFGKLLNLFEPQLLILEEAAVIMPSGLLPNGWAVTNSPAVQETKEMQVRSLGVEDPWRRKWQPTPVFLPEKSHGQRSLVGYHQKGHKELDTTEWLSMYTHIIPLEGWSGDRMRLLSNLIM